MEHKNISIKTNWAIVLFLSILCGCSSARQPNHQMSKDEIIDHYLELCSSKKSICRSQSEYDYQYVDTVYYYEFYNDSMYVEHEYSQLSLLKISYIPPDWPYYYETLPPFVIEKHGVLFLTYQVDWGPGHRDVEEILRSRGRYVSTDSFEYFMLNYTVNDDAKATNIYFTKDNPLHYKIIRSNMMSIYVEPPHFKGVNCKTRMVKAKSPIDLPHYK